MRTMRESMRCHKQIGIPQLIFSSANLVLNWNVKAFIIGLFYVSVVNFSSQIDGGIQHSDSCYGGHSRLPKLFTSISSLFDFCHFRHRFEHLSVREIAPQLGSDN